MHTQLIFIWMLLLVPILSKRGRAQFHIRGHVRRDPLLLRLRSQLLVLLELLETFPRHIGIVPLHSGTELLIGNLTFLITK